jgi:putative hydrolase of the HAD superfamily
MMKHFLWRVKMTIKAIIFDMDDTLYCERDYVMSGLKAVNNWVLQNLNTTGFYDKATQLFEIGEKKLIFNKTLEYLNIAYSESHIDEMINIYRSHTPDIQLFKDAKWVLNHLDKSVKLGVISDGYKDAQKKKVEALNLSERFHSIVLSDLFGRIHWKPSCFPYHVVSLELKCLHQECVYIGDNVTKDFISAKKLGWKTVHIKRNGGIYSEKVMGHEYNAHYQINDLRELVYINELKHLFIKNQKEVNTK